MTIIIFEILLSLISLYSIGKKVFHYFHFTKRAVAPTVVYSVIYFLIIYLVKDTYFGQISFGTFIQQSVANGAITVLLFYPIIIAFSEELFFRLYLSKKTNMLLSAIVFTALHWRPNNFPNLMFPILFVFAILQWTLLKRTKSLWPAIITHIVVLYSLLIIYS